MPLTWIRTADQYPEAGWKRDDNDWVAVERGTVIGRIQRARDGSWQWNVTGVALAPHGLKQSGVEPSQREGAIALRVARASRLAIVCSLPQPHGLHIAIRELNPSSFESALYRMSMCDLDVRLAVCLLRPLNSGGLQLSTLGKFFLGPAH